ATLPASRTAASSLSPLATPSSTHRPVPISPTIRPWTRTPASETRWQTARTAPSVEVFDARAVLLRAGAQRARKLVVPVRLALPALLLEAAPERVMRVVVDR